MEREALPAPSYPADHPPCCCAVQWGRENVFAAMLGGRSLRAAAGMVYGTNCMGGGGLSETCKQFRDQVRGGGGGARLHLWRQGDGRCPHRAAGLEMIAPLSLC